MKTIFTFFISLSCSICFGQTFTGKIVDPQNQAISFANVIVKSTADDSMITGVISDENGVFTVFSEEENIYLEISFVGFSTKKIQPSQSAIGTVVLEAAGEWLDEVVITARKNLIQQKVDRLVFNLENTLAASGGTALSALKLTPGVNVDADELAIVGKGSVGLLINDRLIQLSGNELNAYLSTIASEDIKSIEVLTSPPSKYDAQGDGGLINIVLKKSKKDSWTNQTRSAYTKASYSLFTLGNTFSYNKNRLSIIAALNAKKGHSAQYNQFDISYPSASTKSNLDMKNKEDMISARLGADYQLNSRSSLGFLYSGSFDEKGIIDTGRTTIEDGNNSYTINKGDAGTTNVNHSINGHYIQKLDSMGRKLSLDINYFDFDNSSSRQFSSEQFITEPSYFEAENSTNQNVKNYSAQVDIEYPFKLVNLSYGAKTSFTKTNSDVVFYNTSTGSSILDEAQSNAFVYTENINALYLDLTKAYGEHWQTKIGLRYENTRTKGLSQTNNQEDTNAYGKLFPSLFVAYNPAGKHSFNWSYNRRILRPSFERLNPFRFYINPISYQEGNPFLKPEISDNFELSHNYDGKLISKAFISYVDDGYFNIIQAEDGMQQRIVVTFDNFYTAYNYGLTETFLFSPTKRWNTTSQATISRMDTRYKEGFSLDAELLSAWNFQFYNQNTFDLNSAKTIQGEATFIYASPQTMMYFSTSTMISLDLGLKFSLLDRKLNCTIALNDIFKREATRVYTKTNGIDQSYYNYFDSRNLVVGLNYSFGNKKINLKEWASKNKEEQNRAKKN